MATIVAAAGGGNWTTGSTWVGGVVPTAADDVQLTSASGTSTIVINAAAVCRSLDCTGFTGTLSHAAAVNLAIGDGTAGAGGIALKLVSGMAAYSLGSVTTSTITFVSSATSVQTITTGGKTLGSWTINNAAAKYQLGDANTVGTTSSVTLTSGQLDTANFACSWGIFSSSNVNTRVLTLGSSAITLTGGSTNVWNTGTATGLTLTASSSAITAIGANASFSSGAATFNSVTFSGSGATNINVVSATFNNFTRTITAVKGDTMSMVGNLTVTGTLTLTGNSTVNRLYVQSSVFGATRTISAGTVAITNVDFSDIAGIGTAAPFTGTSLGDCLGNSGITFDAPVTQTHVTGAAGAWSTAAKWTSRVPLPQDDVIVDANTTGGFIIDMPRAGHNVDFTGYAGSFSQSTPPAFYGSLTLGSTMTVSSVSMTFSGRGTHTITSNGKLITGVTFNAFGGNYTLQDALTVTAVVTLNSGTLNTNSMAVSSTTLVSTGTLTRGLTLGTSTWTLTSTAAGNTVNIAAAGLTLSAASSTFLFSTTSTNIRAFNGAGNTFGTLTYTVAGSTGELDLIGANTFTNINFSDATNARTLLLPASTTTSVTGNFNVVGTAGKLMSIVSSSNGVAATLSKASGTVAADYLSIKDSTATGGATWYAGANSTNVSNNSGWLFNAAPVGTSTANFLPFFR